MLELFNLQLRTMQMLTEAQTVIGIRMMGMAGILPSAEGENSRMISEKQTAFALSGLAAAGALMKGKSIAQAYGLALAPIGRVTRANSRRLTVSKRK